MFFLSFSGAWRWHWWYCVHCFLSSIQTVYSQAYSQTADGSDHSHRLSLHQSTWLHVYKVWCFVCVCQIPMCCISDAALSPLRCCPHIFKSLYKVSIECIHKKFNFGNSLYYHHIISWQKGLLSLFVLTQIHSAPSRFDRMVRWLPGWWRGMSPLVMICSFSSIEYTVTEYIKDLFVLPLWCS